MNVLKRKHRLATLWNLRVKPGKHQRQIDDRVGKNANKKKTMAIVDEGEKCNFMDKDTMKDLWSDLQERLTSDQIKALLEITKKKRTDLCLMLPSNMFAKPSSKTKVQHSKYSPSLLCCKLWRWDDLMDSKELRRLWHICPGDGCHRSGLEVGKKTNGSSYSSVPETNDDDMECCNPYHWSRQVSEPPGLALSRNHEEKEKHLLGKLLFDTSASMDAKGHEDESVVKKPRIHSSTETGISRMHGGQFSVDSCTETTGQLDPTWQLGSHCYANPFQSFPAHPLPSRPGRHHWSTIKYWEEHECLNTKAPFRVVDSFLNIFCQKPGSQETGMSLFTMENAHRSDATQRVREHIGLGITLILDESRQAIYIYNRLTDKSVFVSSPYLNWIYGREMKVMAVRPGYLIKAFDLTIPATPIAKDYVPNTAAFSSIFVSFEKGWGEGYSREDRIQCNCWLEICLDNLPHMPTR